MKKQGGKRDTLAQMSHFVSRQSAYQVVGGTLGGNYGYIFHRCPQICQAQTLS